MTSCCSGVRQIADIRSSCPCIASPVFNILQVLGPANLIFTMQIEIQTKLHY